MPLKGQDIIVCLQLCLVADRSLPYAELGAMVGLSPSETNQAVGRAQKAGLLEYLGHSRSSKKPAPRRATLAEFLSSGVRVAFFAQPGATVRGIPTAHAAPPLSSMVQQGGDPPFVWADAEGTVRGQKIEPLYRSVPMIAKRDPAMYELLALVDGVRCGSTRERKLAAAELHARLLDAAAL